MRRNIVRPPVTQLSPVSSEKSGGSTIIVQANFLQARLSPLSFASVRSTSTGTGWACAIRLANAAPRLGASPFKFLVARQALQYPNRDVIQVALPLRHGRWLRR